jgi:hypothetical protein
MTDKMMSMDEAVDWIVHSTGKSRRQAKAMLVEACRKGEVRAVGVREDTGEREAIPPDAWPEIH